MLTVAICTWNRCALLAQTLEQFTAMRVPEGVEWELVLVNNNSTDDTAEVCKRFESRLPLRYVFEATPGLSNARNRAVAEAAGDYILWTDDDVLVDREWMTEYVSAFRRWPEAAIFGGRIKPWFVDNPPSWLPRAFPRVAGAFAALDMGDEPFPLTPVRLPFGANFVVRTAEQRRHLYDPRLGVRPGSNILGEETVVLQAILADGGSGWWVPSAHVQHYIPPARQTTAYLRRYYFGRGQTIARTVADDSPTLFGRPRWLWRQALVSEAKFRLRRLVAAPEIWAQDLVTASLTWGQLQGHADKAAEASRN